MSLDFQPQEYKREIIKLHLINTVENITSWLRNGVDMANPNRVFYSDTVLELNSAYANRRKDDRIVKEDDLVEAFKRAVGKMRRKPEGEALVEAFKPLYQAVYREQMPEYLVDDLTAPAAAVGARR